MRDDFVANLFNPDVLLRELSAWAIYLADSKKYDEYCLRLNPVVVKDLNKAIASAQTFGISTNSLYPLRIDKIRFLLKIEFFKGMSGLVLSEIVEYITELRFRQGDTVIPEYELSDKTILVVVRGKIAVVKNGETLHTRVAKK